MRYLSLLEAQVIKLDYPLVRLAAIERKRHQNLVEMVSEIHEQGMKVIAPMVEQIQELPLLWEAGIDFVQGHGLHKPDSQLNFEFVKNQELTVT
jgi:EAL domain-containing protein (putative c-di-GMP-specific phosphodiesterase class I)